MAPTTKILTADQARKLTVTSQETPNWAQVIQDKLVEISESVEKAARLGKFSLDISTNYITVNKLTDELEKLGYTVHKTFSVENIRISWKEVTNIKK